MAAIKEAFRRKLKSKGFNLHGLEVEVFQDDIKDFFGG